jgi:transposase-like protein
MADDDIAAARREVEAALAREHRPWAHVRFVALSALLSGQTLKAAARSAGVNPGTVSRWLRRLRQHGCDWLLRHPPVAARRLPTMDAQQVARVRRSINRMLMRNPKPCPRSQQRLRAVLLALSGEVGTAADAAYVRPSSVRRWLSAVAQLGPAALLEKPHTGRPRETS